jgi:acylphosphatase
MNKGLEIRITGQVQGVWFRGSAQKEANALGLTGWVQNEPDGSVRLQIFGQESLLEKFKEWCRSGPTHANVKSIEVLELPFTLYTGFDIRRL